jgi:hypothetical protein
MKKLILILLLNPAIAVCQDTATVSQYCEVTLLSALSKERFTFSVVYGDSLREAVIKNQLEPPHNDRFSSYSYLDILNYFGKRGWELLPVVIPVRPVSDQTVFLFRKRFKKSDLVIAK